VCAEIHDAEYVGVSLSDGDISIVQNWHDKDYSFIGHTLSEIEKKVGGAISKQAIGDIANNGVSLYKINTGSLSKTAKVSTRLSPIGTGAMKVSIAGTTHVYPAIILISTDSQDTKKEFKDAYRRSIELLNKSSMGFVKDAVEAARTKAKKMNKDMSRGEDLYKKLATVGHPKSTSYCDDCSSSDDDY
jgi:hypothetical protein